MLKIMCLISALLMLTACTGEKNAREDTGVNPSPDAGIYAGAEDSADIGDSSDMGISSDGEISSDVEMSSDGEMSSGTEISSDGEISSGTEISSDGETSGTMPSDAALENASAVVSMHDTVMRDILGVDYSFAEIAGAGDIYVLFAGGDEGNFLMVALDGDYAATGVVQAYSEESFTGCSLNSLRALFLPFCPEDGRGAFEDWLGKTAYAAVKCARAGEDMELDYFYSENAACAAGVYHQDGKPLFTALIDWYTPLDAAAIEETMTAGGAD